MNEAKFVKLDIPARARNLLKLVTFFAVLAGISTVFPLTPYVVSVFSVNQENL